MEGIRKNARRAASAYHDLRSGYLEAYRAGPPQYTPPAGTPPEVAAFAREFVGAAHDAVVSGDDRPLIEFSQRHPASEVMALFSDHPRLAQAVRTPFLFDSRNEPQFCVAVPGVAVAEAATVRLLTALGLGVGAAAAGRIGTSGGFGRAYYGSASPASARYAAGVVQDLTGLSLNGAFSSTEELLALATIQSALPQVLHFEAPTALEGKKPGEEGPGSPLPPPWKDPVYYLAAGGFVLALSIGVWSGCHGPASGPDPSDGAANYP